MAGGVLTVGPIADPSNYNAVVIAGINTASLGATDTAPAMVVVVTGAERKYKWDIKSSAGSQGQTITYRGWDLAKPKLKFLLWTDAQQRAFYDQIVPVISYDAEKENPKPWDIYHPKTFASQIYWLVTDSIGDLTDEGAQLWTVTVETTEYRQAKAKNATSTPQQANQNQNGKATKPTVADEQDKEIEALREEFRRPI
jgi:hypothetical protein